MIETAEATLLFGAGHEATVESVPEIAQGHGVDVAITSSKAASGSAASG